LILIVAIVAMIFLGISISNFLFWNWIEDIKISEEPTPKTNRLAVSVLIPVRNEAENLLQRLSFYSGLATIVDEIIFYDDESSDETRSVLQSLASKSPGNIRLIGPLEKPKEETAEWVGKNWACHNLSIAAKCDKFIFIDADVDGDVRFAAAVCRLLDRRGFVTVFPVQICLKIWERSVVPMIMELLIFATLPVYLAERYKIPGLVAANGQMMAWRKNDYLLVGGHRAVASNPIEDLGMARRAKHLGVRIRILRSRSWLQCRMYTSWSELRSGFAKNIIDILGGPFVSPGFFAIIISIFGGLFLTKFFWIPLAILFLGNRSFKKPLLELVLHPLGLIEFSYLYVFAVSTSFTKNKTWKGRPLPLR
jgi:glycosyltransferase involved in cell wall biosynthesis